MRIRRTECRFWINYYYFFMYSNRNEMQFGCRVEILHVQWLCDGIHCGMILTKFIRTAHKPIASTEFSIVVAFFLINFWFEKRKMSKNERIQLADIFGLSAVYFLSLFMIQYQFEGFNWMAINVICFFSSHFVRVIHIENLLMFDLIETVFFFCVGFDTILSNSSIERNGLVSVSSFKNNNEHTEHCFRVRIVETGNNTMFYAFFGSY